MHAPSVSTSTLLLCLSFAACQVHAQPMRRQNEDVNIPGEVKIPTDVAIDDVNFDTLVALATSIGIDGSIVTSLAGEIPTGILNTATAATATATTTSVLPTTTTSLDTTETASWDLLPTSTSDSTSTGNPKTTNSRTSTGTTSTSTSSASTSTSTSDSDNAARGGKAALSSSLLVGFTAVLGGVLAGIVVTL